MTDGEMEEGEGEPEEGVNSQFQYESGQYQTQCRTRLRMNYRQSMMEGECGNFDRHRNEEEETEI